jgi:PKHD-type hydroxylase
MNTYPTPSLYWHWENPLPLPVLEAAIQEAKNSEKVEGTVFTGSHLELRSSDVSLYPSWHWLAGVLMNFAIHANEQADWGFTLSKADTLQYGNYKEGQFYDWHQDTPLLSKAPFIRKLTIICMLTDASEYEGGKFELEVLGGSISLKKGDILVFPSSLRHRVTPVTSGLRTTATCWIEGPNIL